MADKFPWIDWYCPCDCPGPWKYQDQSADWCHSATCFSCSKTPINPKATLCFVSDCASVLTLKSLKWLVTEFLFEGKGIHPFCRLSGNCYRFLCWWIFVCFCPAFRHHKETFSCNCPDCYFISLSLLTLLAVYLLSLFVVCWLTLRYFSQFRYSCNFVCLFHRQLVCPTFIFWRCKVLPCSNTRFWGDRVMVFFTFPFCFSSFSWGPQVFKWTWCQRAGRLLGLCTCRFWPYRDLCPYPCPCFSWW